MIKENEINDLTYSQEVVLYDQLYRKGGARIITQLNTPRLLPLSEWEIPKQSIVHYLHKNEDDFGPNDSWYLFKGWNKYKWVYHELELASRLGEPLRKPFQPMIAMKAYRKVYPKLRWIQNQKMLQKLQTDNNSLICINYAFIDKGVKYRNLPFTPLHIWTNKHLSLWKGVSKLATLSDRHQFIEIEVPKSVPLRNRFELASKEFKKMYFADFHEDSQFELLDLWKWMNPTTRKESHIALVPETHLRKINLLFTIGSHVTIVNLHKLNTWVLGHDIDDLKTEENTIMDEGDEEEITADNVYKMIQRRFLKFLDILNKARVPDNTIDVITVTDKEGKSVKYYVDNEIDVGEVEEDVLENPAVEVEPKAEQQSKIDVPEDGLVIDTNTMSITQTKLPPVVRRALAKKENDNISFLEGKYQELTKDIDKFASGKDVKVEVDTIVKPQSKEEKALQEELGEHLQSIVGKDAFVNNLITNVRSKTATEVRINALTVPEKKYYDQAAAKFTTIPNPRNPKQTLAEMLAEEIPETNQPPELEFSDIPFVTDKTMLKSSINSFSRQYIKKAMNRDITRSMMSVQKSGVVIHNYNIEVKKDAVNEVEIHTMQVQPIGGAISTVHVKIPKVREDGTMLVGNTKYYLKNQRADLPIRKVGIDKVALATYFGKRFVTRSPKVKYNLPRWLYNQIQLGVISDKLEVGYKSQQYPQFDLGRHVIVLANKFSTITNKETGITLDFTNIQQYTHPEGHVMFTLGEKVYYDPDKNTVIVNDEEHELLALLGIDNTNEPVEFAEVGLLGEQIPLGLIMVYYKGLAKLCEELDIRYEKVPVGRIQLKPHQYSFRFEDEIWIFDKRDQIGSMLLGGLLQYQKHMRGYSALAYDRKEAWISLMGDFELGIRFAHEFDLLQDMFIDDISRQLLVNMGEPTTFEGLLVRSCELLLSGIGRDEINMEDMVIKGYERISGHIYREMVKAVRGFKMQPIITKRRFNMNPNEVWFAIQNDTSKEMVDEINPIHTLKEKTNVVFGGSGGRSKQSMRVKRVRGYHETDLGVISEASVDNSDVGATTYLSGNPKFTSLYGETARMDKNNVDPTSLYSVATLLSPFSDFDDPKRLLLGGGQKSHMLPMNGNMPPLVRTGYEWVMGYQSDGNYTHVAKQDGKVIDRLKKRDAELITLEYADGSKEIIESVTRYISSSGHTYKHTYTCDYDVGESFKKDDVLVFCTNFFVRDILNKGKVIFIKDSINTTALVDFIETLEDGSCISERASRGMLSEAVEKRTVVVDCKFEVLNPLTVGTKVDTDDILCSIEDPLLAKNSSVFGQIASDTLKRLSTNSPKARFHGTIDKIDMLYFCEFEELSPSLQKLAKQCDAERQFLAKGKGENTITSGQVYETTRAHGEQIQQDQVLIIYYITHVVNFAAGDKNVVEEKFSVDYINMCS